MRILIFCPYANAPEVDAYSSSFIFLLASYLKFQKKEIYALKCDGCLDRCSLDRQFSTCNFRPCISCGKQQKNLISWAKILNFDLSSFIFASDILEINQTLNRYSDLQEVKSKNLLANYLREFPEEKKSIRKLYKTILLLQRASKNLIKVEKPNLLITIKANDLLTEVLTNSFLEAGINVASYNSIPTNQELQASNLKTGEQITFQFSLTEIEHFRSEPSTWDQDLLSLIIQNENFLKLGTNQLTLRL